MNNEKPNENSGDWILAAARIMGAAETAKDRVNEFFLPQNLKN